ncbi:MAG: hypothetical protein ACE5IW_05505 [bacterium]
MTDAQDLKSHFCPSNHTEAKTDVLDGVALSIREGESIGLISANGVGNDFWFHLRRV